MSKSRSLLGTVVIAAVLAHSFGHAYANQPDRCDRILEGDIFNRVITSRTQSSSAHHAAQAYFFQQRDEDAYAAYLRQYESVKQQSQQGQVGASYMGIGVDVAFKVDFSRRLSESEFREEFRRAKQAYEQRTQSSGGSQSALADSYASFVRDPVTIEAWKTCITQERNGIYAFGSRDASGTPYINVMWIPGELAAIHPWIEIDFEMSEGTRVVNPTRIVAAGSGRTFRIETDEQQRSALIYVNAELKTETGQLIRSYTRSAGIPGIVPIAEVTAAAPPAPAAPVPEPPRPNRMPNFVGQVGNPVVNLLACVGLEPVDHCLSFLATEANNFGIDRRSAAEFFFATSRSGVRPNVVWHDQRPGARVRRQAPAPGTLVQPNGVYTIEISSRELPPPPSVRSEISVEQRPPVYITR